MVLPLRNANTQASKMDDNCDTNFTLHSDETRIKASSPNLGIPGTSGPRHDFVGVMHFSHDIPGSLVRRPKTLVGP